MFALRDRINSNWLGVTNGHNATRHASGHWTRSLITSRDRVCSSQSNQYTTLLKVSHSPLLPSSFCFLERKRICREREAGMC